MPGNQPGRRRANDEGTIYYDEHRKRWRGRYTLPNGMRPEVSGRTKRECQQKLRQAIQDRDKGFPTADQRLTVGKWIEYWLTEEAPNTCRPGTLADYQILVKVHILPALGSVRLVELQQEHVQRMLNDMLRNGKSAATVRKVHAVLRSALERAVVSNKIGRNVSALVKPPPETPARPIPIRTHELVEAFLDEFVGHPLELPLMLSVLTGLRCGELLGLAWEDVTLDESASPAVTVRAQLQRIDGEWRRVQPKTKSGRRHVALSGKAVDAFRRQQAIQERARLAAGAKWQDNGLVFTNDLGLGLDGENMYKRYLRKLTAAGLPHITWHELRHWYATEQLNAGATLAEIGTDLGHADSRTTDRYAHLYPKTRRESADRIDRAFGWKREE